MTERQRPHILIVGGGYVGMYTALRLQKKLRRNEAMVASQRSASDGTKSALCGGAGAATKRPSRSCS